MEFLKAILGDGYAAFEASIKAWNEKPENKEKQVKIVDAGSGQYVSKDKYDSVVVDRDNYKNSFQTATDELKKFEGIEDPAKLQAEITRLNGDLTTQKTNYENQIADMKFNSLVDTAINIAGGRSAKAVKAMLDMDTLKASKDQTADINAAIESCKKENSYLFGDNEPINHPVGGTGGGAGGDSDMAAMRAVMGLPSEKSK